jgi:hypothetical protein
MLLGSGCSGDASDEGEPAVSEEAVVVTEPEAPPLTGWQLEVDELCRGYYAAVDALGQLTSLAESAESFARTVELTDDAVADLDQLEVPDDRAEVVAELRSLLVELGAIAAELQQAAADGDAEAVSDGLQGPANEVQVELAVLADELGAPGCAP